MSKVLLRKIPSKRVIQPEAFFEVQIFLQQLLFVHLVGVSVPNVQRAFCGV
jgi:hypothetical protein